jgi:type II secretory pathway pseudopilin PulG
MTYLLFHRRLAQNRNHDGFSLVEVVFALGVVSFCLISITGLLSVGLSSLGSSREKAGAANALEQISSAIRQATPPVTVGGTYQALAPYNDLVWSSGIGSKPISKNYTTISLAGVPTTQSPDQLLTVEVQITPSSDTVTAGSALITVAWPKQATWNPTTLKWIHAQGSASTWLIFRPNK